MFTSAAVWDQAFRFGKGRKERREKFEEKKRKMADEGNIPQEVRDLQPPNEPKPTEEGSETMEKRAKELKQQALEAKAAREIALEKALEEKALEEKENPTESGEASVERSSGSTLAKGKEVEADKEKDDENEGEEEETESSEDEESSSEEEENPTESVKPQSSFSLKDAPAVVESVSGSKDAPAVAEAEMKPQEEELEDEKKERLSREMNERFKEVMRTITGQVENCKSYAATRTVISLWNSLTVSFMTPSEIQEDDLKDAQLLGEINRETLESLDRQKDRAEKFRILLREKEKYLEAERIRKDQEITKKIGWIRQKLTEVRAEEGALERMMQFHESVEDYVTTGLRELRNLQATKEAQEMQWNGLNYDMTKEGGEKLPSMTFYEKLFSERLNPLESNPITELETSLKEFESVTMIDLEAEGRTSAPADAARPAMMPPDVPAMKREPIGTPKTKPMPKPLHKGDGKEEQKKEEKMLRQKKKREEEEAASAARTSYEEAAKRPKKEGQELMKDLINSNTVPREHLEVEITQEVWNLLGWNSRERILCEQRTAEKCYFCNAPGHRAFACSSMLRLACSWGQVTGQAKYGGYDRKHSLWCSSCAFSNTTIALARGEDVKKVSGWYVHTRSACHSKDKCPLKPDEELLTMSSAELLRHLKEKGMFGKEEQELQEKEKEKMMMSRKSEPRSVTASEEPERKRQKKERKEEEKRIKAEKEAEKKAEEDRLNKKREEEEKRIQKETEDRKTSLRDSSDEILHGYLFDKEFRVQTQKAQEAQAKYEKKLVYSILEQTPNYQSRLQETIEHNKRQIDEHNARMLREEKEKILKEEEEKTKERLKRRAERKAAKKILKDVEKDEKTKRKEKKQRKAKE